jgi:hypothetical protein
MNNTAIFERVAAGDITPEQGASEMLEHDRCQRDKRRPSWAPVWLWSACQAVVIIVLTTMGLRRG